MGAEQSSEAQDDAAALDAAAVKLQSVVRGRAARKSPAATPGPKQGTKKVTRLSSVSTEASSTRDESSTNRSSFSSARSFMMSWRPAGFAFAGRKKKRGHQDPKKVYQGLSGLSLQAALGHLDQCNAMLNDGADPNVRDADGDRFPIHWAAARGYTKIIEALIAAGANQYAQDGSNRTPATLASEAEQPGVRNLLQYGPPKPDTKQVYDGMDGPSLHVALNQPAMLKHYLLAGGVADVYDRDNDRTPLHWAAARGAVRCAELLLASGAELDRKDALGRTPKALAYDFNQRELYDFLAQAEGPEKRPSSIFA